MFFRQSNIRFLLFYIFTSLGLLTGSGYAYACELIESVPAYQYRVSTYLRVYRDEASALANSLSGDDIIIGLPGDEHYVYAEEPVSADSGVYKVILPLWIRSSRLDARGGTSGNAGGSVPQRFIPEDPTNRSEASSFGLGAGANDLPVEFGCKRSGYTLTFFTGYLYRASNLPNYLDVGPVIIDASADYNATTDLLTVNLNTSGNFDRRLVLIDSDDDDSTGYSGGFDYLIENGNLLTYTGVAGEWGWDSFAPVSGSTGEDAFNDEVEWMGTIPSIVADAPVRYVIESDEPDLQDEEFGTVKEVEQPNNETVELQPPVDNSNFANPMRGLYKYTTISIDKNHLDENGFPKPEHENDHEYCWQRDCQNPRTDADIRYSFNQYREDGTPN